MRAAFFTDSKVIKYDNKYYSNTLSRDLWKRYFDLADSLTVCSRVINSENLDISKNSLSSYENVSFECIENQNILNIMLSVSVKKFIKNIVLKNDIIVARLPSMIGLIAIKYCEKYDKPYIVEMNGDPWISLWKHSSKGKILAPIVWYYTRKYIRNAKNVIYVSSNFLQVRYPTKGVSISCPDVLLDEPSESVLNRRLERIVNTNNNIVLGLIGSLNVNYRGHDTAIRVVNELNKLGINVKLKFLGSGNPDRWICRAKEYNVHEQIEFDGTLPSGKSVLEWIDQIDILIMPTEAESLGRAIIEAMSRGCPVLGSLETAISEQIGYDCLFKAKDYKTLAKKVMYMVQNKEYMKYCAYENFYRSFKYTNNQTDYIRKNYFNTIKNEIRGVVNDG